MGGGVGSNEQSMCLCPMWSLFSKSCVAAATWGSWPSVDSFPNGLEAFPAEAGGV